MVLCIENDTPRRPTRQAKYGHFDVIVPNMREAV